MPITCDRMNNRNSNNIRYKRLRSKLRSVNFEFPFIFELRLVEKQSNITCEPTTESFIQKRLHLIELTTRITDERKLKTGTFENRLYSY